MNVRSLIHLSVAVVVSYAAYRGVRSFLQNDITLSVTELIYLPPSDGMVTVGSNVPLEGRIYCETYLMRSYRFLLKLSANIQNPSTPPSSARTRSRVTQATDSGSYRTVTSFSTSKRREEFPTLFLGEVHSMVDGWELAQSSCVAFTPACIADELLMSYEGTVKDGCPTNAVVRNCYVQADDHPGLKRLSFELIVNDVIHGAKVRVTLPNRYFEIVKIHTGGLGHIVQPNPRKPQQLVWQIGTVDKTTWKSVSSDGPDVDPEARLARRCFTDDDLAAIAHREENAPVANTHGVLADWSTQCFVERDDEEEEEEESEQQQQQQKQKQKQQPQQQQQEHPPRQAIVRQTSGLPGGAPLLIANFHVVFEEPDGEAYDYLSSDEEAGDEGREADEARGRRTSVNSGAAHSRKAAKREARAKRRQQQRQRSLDAELSSGRGVLTLMPAVELTYSVAGLASGIAVRKLQTLCDRPNWAGKSLLDLWILRWIFPGLYQRQLGKYAHYATWFIQSIPVSAL